MSLFETVDGRRRYEIEILERASHIIYAEPGSEDARYLYNNNDADGLLVSGAKILARSTLKADPLRLLKTLHHEKTEALMQALARYDKRRYRGIKELIQPKDDIRTAYFDLYPKDRKPDLTPELLLNDMIAKAFELIILADGKLISKKEMSPSERRFLAAIRPVISARSDYFSEVFHNSHAREITIRIALANGMQLYQAASSIPTQPSEENASETPAEANSAISAENGWFWTNGEIVRLPNGDGVLVCGDTASGKSFLTIKMLDAGWGVQAVSCGSGMVKLEDRGGKTAVLGARTDDRNTVIFSRLLGKRAFNLSKEQIVPIRWVVTLDPPDLRSGLIRDIERLQSSTGVRVITLDGLDVSREWETALLRIAAAVRDRESGKDGVAGQHVTTSDLTLPPALLDWAKGGPMPEDLTGMLERSAVIPEPRETDKASLIPFKGLPQYAITDGRPKGIVVIGAGHIGPRHMAAMPKAIQCLSGNANVQIVGMVDNDPDQRRFKVKARSMRHLFKEVNRGLTPPVCFRNIEASLRYAKGKMGLEPQDIIALVSVPNEYHLQVARDLAARGITMISVEKPLANTAEDIDGIIALQEGKGIRMACVTQFPFSLAFQRVLAFVDTVSRKGVKPELWETFYAKDRASGQQAGKNVSDPHIFLYELIHQLAMAWQIRPVEKVTNAHAEDMTFTDGRQPLAFHGKGAVACKHGEMYSVDYTDFTKAGLTEKQKIFNIRFSDGSVLAVNFAPDQGYVSHFVYYAPDGTVAEDFEVGETVMDMLVLGDAAWLYALLSGNEQVPYSEFAGTTGATSLAFHRDLMRTVREGIAMTRPGAAPAAGTPVEMSGWTGYLASVVTDRTYPPEDITLEALLDYVEADRPEILSRGRTHDEKMALLCLAITDSSAAMYAFLDAVGDGDKERRTLCTEIYNAAYERLDALRDVVLPQGSRTAFAIAQYFGAGYEAVGLRSDDDSRKGFIREFFELILHPEKRSFAGQWERDYAGRLSVMTARELQDEWDRVRKMRKGPPGRLAAFSARGFSDDTAQLFHPYYLVTTEHLLLSGHFSADEAAAIFVSRIALMDIYLEWASRHWSPEPAVLIASIPAAITPSLDFIARNLQPITDKHGREIPLPEHPAYRIISGITDAKAMRILGLTTARGSYVKVGSTRQALVTASSGQGTGSIEEMGNNIDKELSANGFVPGDIVKQVIFLRDPADRAVCEEYFKSHYVRGPPITTYLHQPSADGARFAAEITAVSGARTEKPSAHMTVVEHDGVRWAYIGGIEPDSDAPDTFGRGVSVLGKVKDLLERHGFALTHAVRFWNYVGAITNKDQNGRQEYQLFNDARSRVFRPEGEVPVRFGGALKEASVGQKVFYPAATGIGIASSNSLAMECLAFAAARKDARVRPLENPWQVDAHQYAAKDPDILEKGADDQKKASPMFSRGMAVLLRKLGLKIILVSGTASIEHSKSLHIGQIEPQTELAIKNIGRVLRQGGARLKDISQLRVYIKDPKDYEAVRRIVEEKIPGVPPTAYVIADVCRSDLLVEIEAVAYCPYSAAQRFTDDLSDALAEKASRYRKWLIPAIPLTAIGLSILLGGHYVSLVTQSVAVGIGMKMLVAGIARSAGSYMQQAVRGPDINWTEVRRWALGGCAFLGLVTYGCWFPILSWLTSSVFWRVVLDLTAYTFFFALPVNFAIEKYWVKRDVGAVNWRDTRDRFLKLYVANTLYWGTGLTLGWYFLPEKIVLVSANMMIVWSAIISYALHAWSANQIAQRTRSSPGGNADIRVEVLPPGEGPDRGAVGGIRRDQEPKRDLKEMAIDAMRKVASEQAAVKKPAYKRGLIGFAERYIARLGGDERAVSAGLLAWFSLIETIVGIGKYFGGIAMIGVALSGHPYIGIGAALLLWFTGGISRFTAIKIYQHKYPDVQFKEGLEYLTFIPFHIGFVYSVAAVAFSKYSYFDLRRLEYIEAKVMKRLQKRRREAALEQEEAALLEERSFEIAEDILRYQKKHFGRSGPKYRRQFDLRAGQLGGHRWAELLDDVERRRRVLFIDTGKHIEETRAALLDADPAEIGMKDLLRMYRYDLASLLEDLKQDPDALKKKSYIGHLFVRGDAAARGVQFDEDAPELELNSDREDARPPLGMTGFVDEALAELGADRRMVARVSFLFEETFFSLFFMNLLPWFLAVSGFLEPVHLTLLFLTSNIFFGLSHDLLFKWHDGEITVAGRASWYHKLGFMALGSLFRAGYLMPGVGCWAPILAFLAHGFYNNFFAEAANMPLLMAKKKAREPQEPKSKKYTDIYSCAQFILLLPARDPSLRRAASDFLKYVEHNRQALTGALSKSQISDTRRAFERQGFMAVSEHSLRGLAKAVVDIGNVSKAASARVSGDMSDELTFHSPVAKAEEGLVRYVLEDSGIDPDAAGVQMIQSADDDWWNKMMPRWFPRAKARLLLPKDAPKRLEKGSAFIFSADSIAELKDLRPALEGIGKALKDGGKVVFIQAVKPHPNVFADLAREKGYLYVREMDCWCRTQAEAELLRALYKMVPSQSIEFAVNRRYQEYIDYRKRVEVDMAVEFADLLVSGLEEQGLVVEKAGSMRRLFVDRRDDARHARIVDVNGHSHRILGRANVIKLTVGEAELKEDKTIPDGYFVEDIEAIVVVARKGTMEQAPVQAPPYNGNAKIDKESGFYLDEALKEKLSPKTLAAIGETVARDASKQSAARLRRDKETVRSLIMELPEPVIVDGKTIRALKFKGVCFDQNEQLDEFIIPTVSSVITFGKDGGYIQDAVVRHPRGGMFFGKAYHQWKIMREAFSRGVLGNYPAGFGEYRNKTFHGKKLGFVIEGLEDPQDERFIEAFAELVGTATKMSDSIMVDVSPEKIRKNAGEILRLAAECGHELRRLHDASIYHRFVHANNAQLFEGKVTFCDLDQSLDGATLTLKQRMGYRLYDIKLLLAAFPQRPNDPSTQRDVSGIIKAMGIPFTETMLEAYLLGSPESHGIGFSGDDIDQALVSLENNELASGNALVSIMRTMEEGSTGQPQGVESRETGAGAVSSQSSAFGDGQNSETLGAFIRHQLEGVAADKSLFSSEKERAFYVRFIQQRLDIEALLSLASKGLLTGKAVDEYLLHFDVQLSGNVVRGMCEVINSSRTVGNAPGGSNDEQGSVVTEAVISRHVAYKSFFADMRVKQIMNVELKDEELPVRVGAAMLYAVYYIEEAVGETYLDRLLENFQVNIPHELWVEFLRAQGFEERARLILHKLTDIDEKDEERVLGRIRALWPEVGHGKDIERKRKALLLGEHAYYLESAGKGADKARKDLVSAYRKLVKKPIRQAIKTKVVAIAPTYTCGNGCRHCQLVDVPGASPKRRTPEERHKVYDEMIRYAATQGEQILVISGGESVGNALDDVTYILSHARPYFEAGIGKKQISLTTNAAFARNMNDAREVIGKLYDAYIEGGGVPGYLCLQVSLDGFHQETVLDKDGNPREKIPLANIINVIQAIQEDFPGMTLNMIGHHEWYSESLWSEVIGGLSDRDYYVCREKREGELETIRLVGPDNRYHDRTVEQYFPFLLRKKTDTNLDKAAPGERLFHYVGDFINQVGWAKYLYDFEFARFDENQMERAMISQAISRDLYSVGTDARGAITLDSAVFENLWSAGNIDEGIENVIDTAEIDPLLIAYRNNQQAMVAWTLEALPELKGRIMSSANLTGAMYEIMKSPVIRLYLTKRALASFVKPGYIEYGVMQALGIPDQKEALIEESRRDYFAERSEIERRVQAATVERAADEAGETGAALTVALPVPAPEGLLMARDMIVQKLRERANDASARPVLVFLCGQPGTSKSSISSGLYARYFGLAEHEMMRFEDDIAEELYYGRALDGKLFPDLKLIIIEGYYTVSALADRYKPDLVIEFTADDAMRRFRVEKRSAYSQNRRSYDPQTADLKRIPYDKIDLTIDTADFDPNLMWQVFALPAGGGPAQFMMPPSDELEKGLLRKDLETESGRPALDDVPLARMTRMTLEALGASGDGLRWRDDGGGFASAVIDAATLDPEVFRRIFDLPDSVRASGAVTLVTFRGEPVFIYTDIGSDRPDVIRLPSYYSIPDGERPAVGDLFAATYMNGRPFDNTHTHAPYIYADFNELDQVVDIGARAPEGVRRVLKVPVLPGVFQGDHRSSVISAKAAAKMAAPGMKVLVIGSGAGLEARIAAERGAAVDAIDINKLAVINTRLLCADERLSGRVNAFVNDLFDGLGRYDLIIFNMPHFRRDDDAPTASKLSPGERNTRDYNGALLKRFARGVGSHLTGGGRAVAVNTESFVVESILRDTSGLEVRSDFFDTPGPSKAYIIHNSHAPADRDPAVPVSERRGFSLTETLIFSAAALIAASVVATAVFCLCPALYPILARHDTLFGASLTTFTLIGAVLMPVKSAAEEPGGAERTAFGTDVEGIGMSLSDGQFEQVLNVSYALKHLKRSGLIDDRVMDRLTGNEKLWAVCSGSSAAALIDVGDYKGYNELKNILLTINSMTNTCFDLLPLADNRAVVYDRERLWFAVTHPDAADRRQPEPWQITLSKFDCGLQIALLQDLSRGHGFFWDLLHRSGEPGGGEEAQAIAGRIIRRDERVPHRMKNPITDLVFPSARNADTLERCIRSFLASMQAFGHDYPALWVLDDADEETALQKQAMLGRLAGEFAVAIHYVGKKEKDVFLDQLAGDPRIMDAGLGRDDLVRIYFPGGKFGSNRNFAQAYFSGKIYATVDDDVESAITTEKDFSRSPFFHMDGNALLNFLVALGKRLDTLAVTETVKRRTEDMVIEATIALKKTDAVAQRYHTLCPFVHKIVAMLYAQGEEYRPMLDEAIAGIMKGLPANSRQLETARLTSGQRSFMQYSRLQMLGDPAPALITVPVDAYGVHGRVIGRNVDELSSLRVGEIEGSRIFSGESAVAGTIGFVSSYFNLNGAGSSSNDIDAFIRTGTIHGLEGERTKKFLTLETRNVISDRYKLSTTTMTTIDNRASGGFVMPGMLDSHPLGKMIQREDARFKLFQTAINLNHRRGSSATRNWKRSGVSPAQRAAMNEVDEAAIMAALDVHFGRRSEDEAVTALLCDESSLVAQLRELIEKSAPRPSKKGKPSSQKNAGPKAAAQEIIDTIHARLGGIPFPRYEDIRAGYSRPAIPGSDMMITDSSDLASAYLEIPGAWMNIAVLLHGYRQKIEEVERYSQSVHAVSRDMAGRAALPSVIFAPPGRVPDAQPGPLIMKRTQQFADDLARLMTFGAYAHMPQWMAALFVAPWYENIGIFFPGSFVAGHEPADENEEISLLEGWGQVMCGGIAMLLPAARLVSLYLSPLDIGLSDKVLIAAVIFIAVFYAGTMISHFLANFYRIIRNAIPGTTKKPLLIQDRALDKPLEDDGVRPQDDMPASLLELRSDKPAAATVDAKTPPPAIAQDDDSVKTVEIYGGEFMLKRVKSDGRQRIELWLQSDPESDIPAMFAYSKPINDNVHDQGLRGVYIDDDFRGLGCLHPLLQLFFSEFPDINKAHPELTNLIALRYLETEYGFKPAYQSEPSIYVDELSMDHIFYMEDETRKDVMRRAANGERENLKNHIQVVDKEKLQAYAKLPTFKPLHFGVTLVKAPDSKGTALISGKGTPAISDPQTVQGRTGPLSERSADRLDKFVRAISAASGKELPEAREFATAVRDVNREVGALLGEQAVEVGRLLGDQAEEAGKLFGVQAAETGGVVSYREQKGQSLILYADDILTSGAVVDLDHTFRWIMKNGRVFEGGKIILFAKNPAKAEIVDKMLRSADAGLKIVTITQDELWRQKSDARKGEVRETEALLEFARTKGASDILGIIRGSPKEPEKLTEYSKSKQVPIVIVGVERALYSFAQALAMAMRIKKSDGSDGWLIVLPPVRNITEDLEAMYQRYQQALVALVAA